MKIINSFLLFLAFTTFANASVENEVRLLDNNNPIAINLFVNKEVLLNFDNNIANVAIKQQVAQKINQESIDKRLWIKTSAIFEDTKILVKDATGKIIVFIVNSSIANKDSNVVKKYKVVSVKKSINTVIKPANKQSLSLVDLTRFASQSLYAPKRLIQDIGLNRVPVTTNHINIFSCSYINCLDIVAKPLISWTDGNKYITAIEIKNIGNETINLDPRFLLGDFITATFQFNRISAKNTNNDTTVLYVVSKQSLEQSL
jgi:integrating conjugative element protein (TIGR03749 family)